MFFVVGRERGDFCLGETRVEFEIRTSRIYQLIDGTWKQVHLHGSIDDPGLLDQYQKAIKSLK